MIARLFDQLFGHRWEHAGGDVYVCRRKVCRGRPDAVRPGVQIRRGAL